MKSFFDAIKRRISVYAFLAACLAISTGCHAAAPTILYTNNFDNLATGKLPEELLVLDGNFSIQESDGNKFLELPGAPLDTFGVLFGPAESNGWAITVAIFGTSAGRRAPTIGPGLNGAGGYKLLSAPGKRTLEIWKGDKLLAAKPYTWESGWTIFKLQVRKTSDGKTKIEGKAWKQGAVEPSGWLVEAEDSEQPPAGRAAVYGSPFSGTPIRFDNIRVERIE